MGQSVPQAQKPGSIQAPECFYDNRCKRVRWYIAHSEAIQPLWWRTQEFALTQERLLCSASLMVNTPFSTALQQITGTAYGSARSFLWVPQSEVECEAVVGQVYAFGQFCLGFAMEADAM